MMKAAFKIAAPYADDAMNLPVQDVDAAIPYYEKTFGFRVVSRENTPHRSVVLARDSIQIGLAENGGDSSQEGCFFEVDNVEAAFEEIKGVPPTASAFRLDEFDGVPYRVFSKWRLMDCVTCSANVKDKSYLTNLGSDKVLKRAAREVGITTIN